MSTTANAPALRFTEFGLLDTMTPVQAAERLSHLRSNDLSLADAAVRSLVASAAPDTVVAWSGTIVVETKMTGDGRFIEENALRWENLPLPLRYVESDTGAHDNAVVVGLIETLERAAGGKINATGVIFLDSDDGEKAARGISTEMQRGVSADLDEVSFEIRVASELLGGFEGEGDDEAEITVPDEDEEGRQTVIAINADDEVMATTSARIRAATLVSIPAFIDAYLSLSGEPEQRGGDTEAEPEIVEEDEAPQEGLALVASAAPAAPPAAWFENPNLTDVTPLTITEDGRIFGHLAQWGTCHTAYPDRCVSPPASAADYAYFRTGAVRTAEGHDVSVGTLTLDTLHAGDTLSAASTLAHYEHTGHGAGYVAAGEDAYGIWVAGAVRHNATSEQVRALRASPLSGDWRMIRGNLELVAALAVNVPGFPVPRPKGLVAGGAMVSLVASGMVPPSKVRPPGSLGALSSDDLRYLKRLAARERAAEAQHQTAAAEMASRVLVGAMAARVLQDA